MRSRRSKRSRTGTTTKKTRSQSELRTKYSDVFQTDAVLTSNWVFRFLSLLARIYHWFFDFSVENIEALPTSGGVLIVTHHSLHNHDIWIAQQALYKATGHLVRGLSHRVLVLLFPLLSKIGFVPGHRDLAVEMLRCNLLVCVIPGGAEEAMAGHENAYNLLWVSSGGRQRLGFAHVAREANVPVVPLAGKSTQEMFFNVFASAANFIGLSRLYDQLLSLPYGIGWVFYQIKNFLWMFVCTCFSVPVPVRSGIVFGEPLQCGAHESTEQFALRVQQALQNLIDSHNPGGLNFSRAIKERLR